MGEVFLFLLSYLLGSVTLITKRVANPLRKLSSVRMVLFLKEDKAISLL